MNIFTANLKTRISRAVCSALVCTTFCTTTPCFTQDTARGIVAESTGTAPSAEERPDPEMRFQLGHSNQVTSVAWSPNGKYIASGSGDKTVKIWDAASGKELRTLTGHSSNVSSVTWSPDGKYIASGSDDTTVKVWNAESGKEFFTLIGHSGEVTSVAWSPNSKYIASGSDDTTVKVWNAESGKEFFTLIGHSGEVTSVAWSPDSKYIASGGDDTTVKVWNTQNRKKIRTLSGHSYQVTSVAWSPDSKYIASVGRENIVKIWNIANEQEEKTFSMYDAISVSWSPDGKFLAVGSYKYDITVFNTATGIEVTNFWGSEGWNPISWSPDSKFLAYANVSRTNACSDEIYIKDIIGKADVKIFEQYSIPTDYVFYSSDGNHITSRSFLGHIMRIWDALKGVENYRYDIDYYAAMSSDKKYIANLDPYDNIVEIQDVATREKLLTISRISDKAYSINSIAWSPDNKYIASVGDHTVKVWNTTDGKERYSLSKHSDKVKYVTWSLDSKYIASIGGDCDEITIWDAESGKELQTLTGHSGWMNSVSWSPDSKYFASVGNHTVKVWNTTDGKEIRKLADSSRAYSVTWSPDGKYIASEGNPNDDNSPQAIWDANTGNKLSTLIRNSGPVCSIVWSLDSKYIASTGGYYDDMITIWDAESGKELQTLTGHSGWVNSVSWSPDGKYIVSGSDDGTIKIWDAQNGTLLSTTINGKNGEWLTYTPEGFFCGSEWATKNLVYIVDGMDVIGIDQVYDAYYRPDLVAAKIRGEDIFSYASSVQLASLVRSGSAPLISFADIPSESLGRDMAFGVSVRNTSGGIGAVNLLLNGKAIRLSDGVASKDGETVVFHHTVTLQNGTNTLEAFALNGAGLVESVRAHAEVVWRGATEKPDLYVLTAAVNKYRDKSLWLNYAVPDAEAIADGFQKQKSGLYRNVHIAQLNDGEVTKENLAAAFSRLSQSIRADDVFVFFVSGHGTTYDDGDYYYLPSDFRYTSKDSIPTGGISKNDLLANLSKIKAGKTLVMLDTCNSGAFLSDFGQRGLSEKTAIDRLTRATGHATLAASSDTQAAMEGYNGHGVFTYVLLEGIAGAADSDGDGYVTLNELSAFVEKEVPERSYEKWGYEQVPQKDLRRQDFPIAGK